MIKNRLVTAEENEQIDVSAVKNKLQEIQQNTEDMVAVYTKLYQSLQQLYIDYPAVYAVLGKTVQLPTNAQARAVVQMAADTRREMEYLRDDEYLRNIMSK